MGALDVSAPVPAAPVNGAAPVPAGVRSVRSSVETSSVETSSVEQQALQEDITRLAGQLIDVEDTAAAIRGNITSE